MQNYINKTRESFCFKCLYWLDCLYTFVYKWFNKNKLKRGKKEKKERKYSHHLLSLV